MTEQTTTTSLETLKQRFAHIPITGTLPFELHSVGQGTAEMSLPYRKGFDGVFDSLHGGLLMTLADTAACAAVMTLAGEDSQITTTDMNIRFLSACRSACTAHARVIKFGRTLVPVAVDLVDENGTTVALAQVTYMRLKPSSPEKR